MTTPNFGWDKPTVGGSNGTWGTILNATLDAIDAAVDARADEAASLDARLDAIEPQLFNVVEIDQSGPTVNLDISSAQIFFVRATLPTMTLSLTSAAQVAAGRGRRVRVVIFNDSGLTLTYAYAGAAVGAAAPEAAVGNVLADANYRVLDLTVVGNGAGLTPDLYVARVGS